MQATVLQDGSQAIGVLTPLERISGTKALTLPEILDTILGHATPPTLASAACVSRVWSTIALDRLWSGYDVKVSDLLWLLPLDFKERPPDPTRHWSLQRSPTKEEWARFCSYTSRVSSLVMPTLERHLFDPRITEWEVKKDVLFPRLRRIRAPLLGVRALSLSRLRHFVTPGLRELLLHTDYLGEGSSSIEVQSLLNDLAIFEGLLLQKFNLRYSVRTANMALAVAIGNLAIAHRGSIEALELLGSHLNVSSITEHSLLNLRALSFGMGLLTGGGDRQPIQVLVEGCPNVTYLRIQFERVSPSTSIFNLPGLRMILAWDLLSFEMPQGAGVYVTNASMEEMARAWPKLKKLNLDWNVGETRIYHPFSRLADILSVLPQLEELGASFYYREEEETLLSTFQPSSEQRRPSRLQRLQFGSSGLAKLPPTQRQRDCLARFLARVLPPGLRIHRPRDDVLPWDSWFQPEPREEAEPTGRDNDPQWDALFRQIEELQGGVRILVGSLPGDSDGVWF